MGCHRWEREGEEDLRREKKETATHRDQLERERKYISMDLEKKRSKKGPAKTLQTSL